MCLRPLGSSCGQILYNRRTPPTTLLLQYTLHGKSFPRGRNQIETLARGSATCISFCTENVLARATETTPPPPWIQSPC